MAEHESGVNYKNLIRDLADMYPFEISEVVLVELIANSLDARPTRIAIEYDPVAKVLTVTDNGKGMSASEFEQYHDFAAGLKTRGGGIGFAGVGAKISFSIADRVITETNSDSFTGGSNWHLESNKKLVWEDIQPSHLHEHGTRVEVQFRRDSKPSFSSIQDFILLLRRHYFPLLDSNFLALYQALKSYTADLQFTINSQIIRPSSIVMDFRLEKVKEFFPEKAGKRIGYGVFGLAPSEYPLGPDLCGVLLCTYGKVIRTDFFNQFPGPFGPRILGVVEIPSLVNFLTTSKTDFNRRGKLREFEALYNPVRQEFKDWLSQLGVEPTEIAASDEALKLERELKKLLDEIPELSDFFGFRTNKKTPRVGPDGTVPVILQEGTDPTFPIGEGEAGTGLGIPEPGEGQGQAPVENEEGREIAKPISRKARRGPKVAFANVPDRLDLAWVDGNNVVINSGHPSYVKIHSDVSARRLHCLFAIGNAVQRFLAGDDTGINLMFVDNMMAAWGKK